MSDDRGPEVAGVEETRNRLRQLIDAWEAGAVDEWAVREEAEVICLAIPWDELELGVCGPVYEVADQLDGMMHGLITKDDIAALRTMLEADQASADEACASWREYCDSIDLQARARQLITSPFYGGTAASELAYPTRRTRR